MTPYTNDPTAAGWFHLLYFGIGLPVAIVWLRKGLLPSDQPLPDRVRFFQRTAFSLVLFAMLSLGVAWVERLRLFPASPPSLRAIVAGFALYALAVAFMRPRWRRAVERRARVAHLFMPSNARERGWWIAVSILAGVGEEITWRGVQTVLLWTVIGNFWIAALLSSTTFGLTHVVQGWRTAVLIVVFALGFHWLVWLAGSLYVAMAVHVAYDITAGITLGRLGRELAARGEQSEAVTEVPHQQLP